MTDDVRARELAIWHRTLYRRVCRLQRLLAMRAPIGIIGIELRMVMQAALLYCGHEFYDALFNWLARVIRNDHGLCECGRPLEDRTQPWCTVCEAELAREEAALTAGESRG